MDLVVLLLMLLKSYWWLATFGILTAIFKSPWFKGWWGEYLVRDLIRRRLSPEVYREFHNVTIHDEFGETTQIDHVYVSPFGVLVIETKHMGHWIFGSEHQKLWTQQIYRHKTQFRSPLRQNYRHIKALESLLGMPEQAFKSVIVFTGECTFKTEMPDEVCTLSDLIEYIHSIDTRILTSEQVESICRDLQRLRLKPSFRMHHEHIESLRRRHRGVAPVTAQAGLGPSVAKVIVGAMALFLIWWALTRGIGSEVHSLQSAQRVEATAPQTSPAPVVQSPNVMAPMVARVPQQPAYRQPTAAEMAEWQRQSEESMRVLERNTREVPLALPGSPEVGPP